MGCIRSKTGKGRRSKFRIQTFAVACLAYSANACLPLYRPVASTFKVVRPGCGWSFQYLMNGHFIELARKVLNPMNGVGKFFTP